MVTLRLRYQDGQFVPLEPVSSLNNGDEIEVRWQPVQSQDKYQQMLDRTAGLWADIEGIEEFLEEARKIWDEEWQTREIFAST